MSLKNLVSILFFAFLFLFQSCGKDADEKRKEAILEAQIYLSEGQCTKAINVLEAAGRDDLNATYLKTLSSSYACRAGYNTGRFFSDDLALVGNSSSVLGGFTLFSTSDDMTEADEESYEDLQTAIDILLYAGGISLTKNPTTARRERNFTSAELQDIHPLLLYYLMAQLGRYLKFYGNADATGEKGRGDTTSTNDCFHEYENISYGATDTDTYLGTGVTGDCNAASSGHGSLGSGTTPNIARMCQGVVLLNNFLSLVATVVSDIGGDDFNGLGSLDDDLTAAKATILALEPNVGDVLDVLSQSKCETDNANSTTDATQNDYIQLYFMFLFETLFS